MRAPGSLTLRPLRFLSVLLVLGLLGSAGLVAGCASDPEISSSEKAHLTLQERHQSAYVALVRVLETLDAIRDPAAEVRVRAVECDSMRDPHHGGEFVRVILDLTVLAPDFDRAQAVFEDLAAALEAEGRETSRLDRIASHRVARVFAEMDWAAKPFEREAEFATRVSISDSIRAEVHFAPGAPGPLAEGAPGPLAEGAPEIEGSVAAGDYIRDAALDVNALAAPVSIDVHVTHPRVGTSDVSYRIRPAEDDVAFRRIQIGHFLQRLEALSPGVRITHLSITPYEPGTSTLDGWTFEADMSIRILGT